MKFDGFGTRKCMFFGQKCCSEGGFAIIIEFLVCESSEYGGLSDSGISDSDEFDLCDISFFLFWHINNYKCWVPIKYDSLISEQKVIELRTMIVLYYLWWILALHQIKQTTLISIESFRLRLKMILGIFLIVFRCVISVIGHNLIRKFPFSKDCA